VDSGCRLLGKAAILYIVRFRILIQPDEDGIFVATCPSLPGCVSQGDTREEARKNIEDAIGGYVASLQKHGEPVPPSIDEDIVEVAV
jgi:antitoxin HicB